MIKTPIYDRRASDAYIARLKAKGWVRVSIFVPAEIKAELMEARDKLLADYNASREGK